MAIVLPRDFSFLKNWNTVALNVVLSLLYEVTQPYGYIYPLPLGALSSVSPANPFRASQGTELSSLLYNSFPLAVVLHIGVYVCQPQSPSLSLSLLPLLCPHVHSLGLCLYLCLGDRFICIIFLDSTCMC